MVAEINFHPHIHAIVPGGGLDAQNRWKEKGNGFFLPIHIISRKFRGRYMAESKQLWQGGRLVFGGTSKKYRNHYAFRELMDACYKKEWIPHCNETFNGAQSVISYLGKYTHRITVSNHRIDCMDENTVTFSVKDYGNGGGRIIPHHKVVPLRN